MLVKYLLQFWHMDKRSSFRCSLCGQWKAKGMREGRDKPELEKVKESGASFQL